MVSACCESSYTLPHLCSRRTRSGDLVRLVELLDEAKKRAYDGIVSRKQETGEPVDEAEAQVQCFGRQGGRLRGG